MIVQKKSHLPGNFILSGCISNCELPCVERIIFLFTVGDDEKGYVTRLARICVSDVNYDTYTEVTIDCGGYGIVRDAYFVDNSESLASRSEGRTSQNEPFLVASFTNGKGPDEVSSGKKIKP